LGACFSSVSPLGFCFCSSRAAESQSPPAAIFQLPYTVSLSSFSQEAAMRESRRAFVLGVAAAAGGLATNDVLLYAQRRIIPPPPPEPAEKGNPADVHSNPAAAAAAKRARLRQNEKEFREGVERLCQLTSSLRDELQKTATTDIFSLHIVKETEEIEKLAKLLKSKAKSA
jgi:hypothetical protein